MNSVDFEEFAAAGGMDEAKRELMGLAEYEREGVERAWRALEGEVKEAVRRALRVFVDVTDLYGLIYVQRDIASRRI